MEHGEVHDESENAYEVFKLGKSLQPEDQEWEQHLLLVDMETVQKEG